MADIFHVLNRGVDKRKIFLDNQDYFRFIHDLFEFNNQERVNNVFYSFYKFNDIGCRNIKDKKPRKLLVDIHAFCLMSNHYHLLLSPRVENGIPKFMKKMNMGYAKYFNEKYKRKGTLFESRYKSILITEHAHFLHLPYYIHLNPLDLKFSSWREKKLKNYKEAMAFLEKYRWSSFLDYIGKKNFPSITNRKFLLDFFGGEEKYKKETLEWLKEMDFNVEEVVKGVALE